MQNSKNTVCESAEVVLAPRIRDLQPSAMFAYQNGADGNVYMKVDDGAIISLATGKIYRTYGADSRARLVSAVTIRTN